MTSSRSGGFASRHSFPAPSAHQRLGQEKAIPKTTGTEIPYGYDSETNTVGSISTAWPCC
ncbi:hypothetical protein ABZY05_47005 [Streptomyces canus]|uniref:hypothetical protein n=1 Tax=Streptomyces canus TaxID=58343 RepID=UPI0033BD2646